MSVRFPVAEFGGAWLWCPGCVVSIYIPAARARFIEKIKCRICNESFDNPLFVD